MAGGVGAPTYVSMWDYVGEHPTRAGLRDVAPEHLDSL